MQWIEKKGTIGVSKAKKTESDVSVSMVKAGSKGGSAMRLLLDSEMSLRIL